MAFTGARRGFASLALTPHLGLEGEYGGRSEWNAPTAGDRQEAVTEKGMRY